MTVLLMKVEKYGVIILKTGEFIKNYERIIIGMNNEIQNVCGKKVFKVKKYSHGIAKLYLEQRSEVNIENSFEYRGFC